MKIAFLASQTEKAEKALKQLVDIYGQCSPSDADYLVTLGGDGHLLEVMHHYDQDILTKPIYGMNLGSMGFLLNRFIPIDLVARIENAQKVWLKPLLMRACDAKGLCKEALAINEVSLLRQTRQAAHLQIAVDGVVRMKQLVCDGLILATPAGSTAYNLSANGPILPLRSQLLAMTPLSPFRPRRWPGALLPEDAQVEITILGADKRPVHAVADSFEVRNVTQLFIRSHPEKRYQLLFDPDQHLEERIFQEQFAH